MYGFTLNVHLSYEIHIFISIRFHFWLIMNTAPFCCFYCCWLFWYFVWGRCEIHMLPLEICICIHIWMLWKNHQRYKTRDKVFYLPFFLCRFHLSVCVIVYVCCKCVWCLCSFYLAIARISLVCFSHSFSLLYFSNYIIFPIQFHQAESQPTSTHQHCY